MSNETQQEQWNQVHAQLLKSVADAQAKLLAAQNETNDRLETMKGVLADAAIMKDGLFSYRREMMAKIDAIGAQLAALLAPPRRQVERLRTKRIPAAKRNRR